MKGVMFGPLQLRDVFALPILIKLSGKSEKEKLDASISTA